MKHIKKFNETVGNEPEKENILEKIFRKLGIVVQKDGKINATNKFGKLLCLMAVKQNEFEKIGDNLYQLKK